MTRPVAQCAKTYWWQLMAGVRRRDAGCGVRGWEVVCSGLSGGSSYGAAPSRRRSRTVRLSPLKRVPTISMCSSAAGLPVPERGAGGGLSGLLSFHSAARCSGRPFGGLVQDWIGNPNGLFRTPLTRHRTLVRLFSPLAVLASVWACGDSPAVPTTTVTDPDHAALVALYGATGGPNRNHNDHWLRDAPLGAWYGVEAEDQGRVIGLYFRSNRLTGRLTPELGSLANLRSLFNWLDGTTGSIPLRNPRSDHWHLARKGELLGWGPVRVTLRLGGGDRPRQWCSVVMRHCGTRQRGWDT